MEEWQVESLRHIWKKMKLDECVVEDYSYSEMRLIRRVYMFPNGIRVECSTQTQRRYFADLKAFVNAEIDYSIFQVLNPANTTRKKKEHVIEYQTKIVSQKEFMDSLWGLYTLNHPNSYGPDLPRDDLILCPRCETVYSYDLKIGQTSVKCPGCTKSISLRNSNQ